MLSFWGTSNRKKIIWKAVLDDDKNAIARLLPKSTAEDLQYEEEVILFK